MKGNKQDESSLKIWEVIAAVIIIIGAGIFAFYISEKVILIYEYGFTAVFDQGIHFVETKPYIVTSAGDTFGRYHNLFHFLFPIVPFVVTLFIIAMIKVLITGKYRETPVDEKIK